MTGNHRFRYDCALRWSDMDAFGHVNNAVFLTLYEEARVELMFHRATEAGVTSFADGVVIARHEIDYLRPVDCGTAPAGGAQSPQVRIELWLEQVRASRFVVAYEMFAAGALASRARTVCVPYDLAAGRIRRLCDAERDYLLRWLAPS